MINMMLLVVISALFLKVSAILTFPDASLTCPQMTSLCGHSLAINEIRHIPGTLFYISLDLNKILLISDIRTGEVFQRISYSTDTVGVRALASMSNGDTLYISTASITIYSVFQNRVKYTTTFTSSSGAIFGFSYTQSLYLYTSKTSTTKQECFITVQFNLSTSVTQFLLLDNTPTTFYTWKVGIKTVTSGRQPLQPTYFFYAQDVVGIAASSTPVNIIVGFSTTGDMYAATFPTYNFVAESINAGTWQNLYLTNNVTTYTHLKGTTLIAIQYTTTYGSGQPVGCTADYCLGFYDLSLLTYDVTYPTTFILTAMMAAPVKTKQLSSSSYIVKVLTVTFSGEHYIAFMDIANALYVYKISDFVANGCNMNYPNKITFATTQTIKKFASINIDSSVYMLIGFSGGTVARVDFSTLISPATATAATSTSVSSFAFTQTYPGISTSFLVNSLLDQSTYNLYSVGAYSSNTTILTVPFTEYNIFTQVSKMQSFTFTTPTTYQFTVISTNTLVGIMQTGYQLYAARVSGVCPATPVFSTVLTYLLAIKSTAYNNTAALSLVSLNFAITSIYTISKLTFSSNQYAAVIFLSQAFTYSDYCLNSTLTGTGGALPSVSSYSVGIFIIDLTGNILGKTDTSFITQTSITQTFIATTQDATSNYLLLFQTFLRVINLQLSNSLFDLTQYLDVSSTQLFTMVSALNPAITSFGSLLTAYIIPNASQLIIQFNDSAGLIVYTGVFTFSPNWNTTPANLNIAILSVISSTSTSSDNPNTISQYISWSSSSSLMAKVSTQYRIYQISSTGALTLSTIIRDKFGSLSQMIPYVYSSKQQFLKISSLTVLERISLADCLDNKCYNSICQFNFSLAYNSPSVQSDVYQTTSNSDLHIRVEEFDVSSLKLYSVLSSLQSTSINQMVNINVGNNVSLQERYLWVEYYYNLKPPYTVVATSLNLQVQTADLSQFPSIIPSTNAITITKSATFSLSRYNYVKLNNLIWSVDLSTLNSTNWNIFTPANSYFIIENIQLSLSGKSPTNSYRYAAVTSGLAMQINNTSIVSQSILNAYAYFLVNVDNYSLYFYNLNVTNSLFQDSTFIYSSYNLMFLMQNSIFVNNVIQTVSTTNSYSYKFISAQTTQFSNVSFKSNLFVDATIQGLNQQTNYFTATLDTVKYISNTFISDQLVQPDLLFNGKLTSYILNSSTFSLVNSVISSNTYLICKYSLYLTQSCPDQQTLTSNQAANTYLMSLDYMQKVTMSNIESLDNTLALIYYIRPISFTVDQLTCGNSQVNLNMVDYSCIKMSDFSSLTFKITNSKFFNKTLSNSYVIDASSDQISTSSNGSFEGSFALQNINFTNISLTTTTSFYVSSTLHLVSLQIFETTLSQMSFDRISFQSPDRLFYGQASCILISAPFSTLVVDLIDFTNLATSSSAAAVYLDSKTIALSNSNFYNNNYDFSEQTYKGGFLDVQSNSLTATNTTFIKGLGKKGSAVSITPSSSNASYLFTSCVFKNLIATTYGAAVYVTEPLNSTALTFSNCSFTQIASKQGGVVYIAFSISSSTLSAYSSVLPSVNISSSNSTHLYSSQGGLVYAEYSSIILNSILSTENNPKNVLSTETTFQSFIKQLQTIGTYISTIYCQLSGDTLKISGHSVDQSKSSDSSNIVFLQGISSTLTIKNSVFTNNIFSSAGFIEASSSVVSISSTSFTQFQYFAQSSSRLLSTDIASTILSKFSAVIIQSISTFSLSNIIMDHIKCNSQQCLGGALAVFNSHGSIQASSFTNNYCQLTGGAIAFVNLNGNTLISQTNITNNTSSDGNGGGLAFITNLNTDILTVKQSIIESNTAQEGGGVYLEFQTNPTTVSYLASFESTSIQYNSAQVLGGGVFYQGYTPNYVSATIANNKAKSTFGQNSFSFPKSLLFNKTLSMKQSSYIYSQTAKGIKIYNQVSGTPLPHIILNLVDESGLLIDKTYAATVSTPIVLDVDEDTASTPFFVISSEINEFSFSEYFNISSLILTGTPGTVVTLQLTSTSIQSTSSTSYSFEIEVELRSCIQGEVFKNFTYSGNLLYQCSECSPGYYSLQYPILSKPINECYKCLANAQCPGGSVIDVNYGYWRINDQTNNLIECLNSHSNCLGGTSNFTCATGHVGPLCESCNILEDYSTAGNFQCGSCGDQVSNSLKIIGIFVVYILSAKLSVDGILKKLLDLYKIRNRLNQAELEKVEQNTTILLKLILNYFQIIMVITTFKISVPHTFDTSFDVIASPTTQIIYSFECFFYQLELSTGVNRIYIQLMFSILLPIACIIIFFISGSIVYRKDEYLRSFYLTTSFLYSLMYFQPQIFKNAISLISCREIDNLSYIRYNVSFECYSNQYVKWSLSFVLPVILITSVVIPVVLLVQIYSKKNNLILRRKYIFMTGEYSSHSWFWEFVKMYIKLLIMCCLTFFEYDIPNKILFIFLLMVCYGLLLFYQKPYTLEKYTRIDLIQTSVLCISIYLGFIAYQNSSQYAILLFSLLLILIINVGFLMWSIKLLTHAYMYNLKSRIEEIKITLVKGKCTGKYCFTRKARLYYLRRRWIKSVLHKFKISNMINSWTGKLKVNKLQLSKILKCESHIDDISKELSKPIPNDIDFSQRVDEGVSPYYRQQYKGLCLPQSISLEGRNPLKSQIYKSSIYNELKMTQAISDAPSFISPSANQSIQSENNFVIELPSSSMFVPQTPSVSPFLRAKMQLKSDNLLLIGLGQQIKHKETIDQSPADNNNNNNTNDLLRYQSQESNLTSDLSNTTNKKLQPRPSIEQQQPGISLGKKIFDTPVEIIQFDTPKAKQGKEDKDESIAPLEKSNGELEDNKSS